MHKLGGIFFFLVILAFTGCQVDRTSLQMDSDSRFPALGIQLVPKRKPQKIQTISHHESLATPEKAMQTRQSSTARSSRWTQWLNPFGKKQRIPIPRTDLQDRTQSHPEDRGLSQETTESEDF